MCSSKTSSPRPGGRTPRSASAFAEGVIAGDRAVLARAITLVESRAQAHQQLAAEVLERVLPRTGGAMRVGITGSPGVGKSCLVEALGLHLTRSRGLKVAVLAVDPSSTRTGGSILGDKTRMIQLSRDPLAFIRPSPAGDSLGGVARRTREAMLLCEAAGFDVVLVETVGVGQSEVTVRGMVDFFLLLMLAGAGDELQGIKRGVIELADCLAITKADGDNVQRAELARGEFARALHYLAPATQGWEVKVRTCSSVTGAGIPELWQTMERYRSIGRDNGGLRRRRTAQARDWMRSLVAEQLQRRFYDDPRVRARRAELEQAVEQGRMTAPRAASELLLTATVRPPEG